MDTELRLSMTASMKKGQLAAAVAETSHATLTTADFFKNFIWALKYSTPSAQNGTEHDSQKRTCKS